MPGFWNLKTTELFNQLSIKSFAFIGRYKKDKNDFAYFDHLQA